MRSLIDVAAEALRAQAPAFTRQNLFFAARRRSARGAAMTDAQLDAALRRRLARGPLPGLLPARAGKATRPFARAWGADFPRAVLLVDRSAILDFFAATGLSASARIAAVCIDGTPAPLVAWLARSFRAGQRAPVLYLHDAATVVYPFTLEPLASLLRSTGGAPLVYRDLGLPPLGAAARRFSDPTLPPDEPILALEAIPPATLVRWVAAAVDVALRAQTSPPGPPLPSRPLPRPSGEDGARARGEPEEKASEPPSPEGGMLARGTRASIPTEGEGGWGVRSARSDVVKSPRAVPRLHDAGPRARRAGRLVKTQTIVATRRCNQGCGFCDRVRSRIARSLARLARRIHPRSGARGGARNRPLRRGAHAARGSPRARPRRPRGGRGRGRARDERHPPRLAEGRPRAPRSRRHRRANLPRHQQPGAPRRSGRAAGRRRCGDDPAARLPRPPRVPRRGPARERAPPNRARPAPAAARIGGLHEAFPALRRFVLAPVGAGARTFRADQALPPEAVAEELALAYKAGERARVEVELAPDPALPPCIVDVRGDARRLFARLFRSEEGAPNDACPACASCAIARRCAVKKDHLEAFGGPALARPVEDEGGWLRPGKSPGSRLRVLGAAEVETFFHVDYDYGEREVWPPTSRLGIVYRCNQVCTFCELADMDTDVSPEKVRAAIDASRARGSERLIVTGGEPTLSPRLVEYVGYARDRGFAQIELQTNAVLLDRPGFAEALRAAGLTSAQVSLHGPDGAISDRLTAAPGTHRRTLEGVTRLLGAGVRVLLNHLVFKDNCHLLVNFVEMCEARWAAHRQSIVIQFHSPRNEFQDREEGLRHVARYTDYAAVLTRAHDRARSSASPCTISRTRRASPRSASSAPTSATSGPSSRRRSGPGCTRGRAPG